MCDQISLFDYDPSVMPVPDYRDCWRTCKNYLTNGSEACIIGSNQVGTGGEDVTLETVNGTVKMFCRFYEEGQRNLEFLEVKELATILTGKTGYVFTLESVNGDLYARAKYRHRGMNIYADICLERYHKLCVYPDLIGKRYIDIDIHCNSCGSGRPTDSIPEAVDAVIELMEYHKKLIDRHIENGDDEEDQEAADE